MDKRILFIFLLLLNFTKAFSAVYVVTSNADSGPGTLRDALTQAAANGSATQDIIQFNFADQSAAGRTIILLSQLPDISSNLVIDGTTQPGVVFGQSDARVKITTPDAYSAYPIEYIPMTIFNGKNLSNIEIYGLYLYDYYDIIISYPDLKPRTGISITGSTNITIGAAGKGNLIRGFRNYTIDLENTDNIAIQHNVVGLNDQNLMGNGYDGDDLNEVSAPINLSKCNHILFGGNANEGNTIFTGIFITFYQQTTNNALSIKSNNFVVFPDGHTTVWVLGEWYGPLVSISTVFDNNVDFNQEGPLQASANIDINNNLLSGTAASFSFQSINGTTNVTNNYFNIARDGTTDITYYNMPILYAQPLSMQNCNAQFNIGTSDPSKRNLFNNINVGVVATACPNIFLRYNDFKCVATVAYVNNIPPNSYTLPALSIGGVNVAGANTTITGTAAPNAIVDIYSSESCRSQCSIRSYIKTITADNAGNWQTSILNLNGIFYASATVGNQTSLFKTFEVNSANVNIQSLRCTNTATITGLKVPTGVSYYWKDENGNVVANTLDLTTTKTGKYQLVLAGGCITSQWFEIDDNRVQIIDAGLTKTDISCGINNGSIKGIFVYDPLSEIGSLKWTDGGGTITGSTADISGLAPGSYTLTVSTTDGCTNIYGPVVLKSISGPNIDQSKAVIQSTNCGQSTGSITNLIITGTGTLQYTWQNSMQQTVSTSKDLLNQPGGTYRLAVTDGSQCGPVYTTDMVIPETNIITLDESNVQITLASCSLDNGSITGMQVSGNAQYKWVDANNNTVATTIDLQNAAPGDYVFTAYNQFGCSQTSKSYHIGTLPPTQYPAYNNAITAACANTNNGSINLTTDGLVKSARWVNSQGATVGNTTTLSNVQAGVYGLYLTDQNGCETFYNNFTVDEISPIQILQSSAQITNIQCSVGLGSITGIEIAGGQLPYSYTWTDAGGNVIASTPDVTGLSAGDYTLTVQDARSCNLASGKYIIQNIENIIPAPSAANIQLCSPGEAFLMVNNPSPGYIYHL
ncbi:MAG TPA: hypothetical protein VFE54_06885, partial [Mucilaginibacter sp.]|nr:hypothetical protein [Mucilaginibacter sp.]